MLFHRKHNSAVDGESRGSIYEREMGLTTVPEKRRSGFSKKMVATLVAGCMVLSLGMGFGGTLLANSLSPSSTQPVVNIGGGSTGGVNAQNVKSTTGTDLSVTDIAKKAANSVVEITTEALSTNNWMQQYITTGAGSGVIISTDGYIVTNNHVIDGANKIVVTLKDGTTYNATLVGTDSKADLAVLKIDATNLQAAEFGDSDALEVGELAVAIGNPLGQLGGTVTDGIISALDREITIDGQTMTLLQTNAAINPGNSGGGLFNGQGQLIGVVNAKSSGSDIEGLGFAIPINYAKTVISDLITYGYVQGRIEVGLSLIDIQDTQTAMMYRVNELGTYVTGITEGSSAEQSGFQPGDRIASIDGQEIQTYDDIKAVFDQHKVNDVVSVVVVRNGQQVTLSLILTQYHPASAQNGNAA